MILTNDDVFNVDQLYGDNPRIFYGTAAPDATKAMWGSRKKQGSMYIRQVGPGHIQKWERVSYTGQTWDWRCQQGWIQWRLDVNAFTDDGATIGHFDIAQQIPLGAVIETGSLTDVVNWLADTTATIQIGDGTTVARYSTGTPSIFTTAAAINLGVPSGQRHHTAAATIRATVTGTSDFTLIKTNGLGRATLSMPYHF